jgi:CBS domain-containing protein
MKIRDIMVSDVETAEPDDTLDEIAMMMREQDVGAIPVVEDGELIGIITDRDIVVRCIAEGRDPADVAADEIITGDLQTVEPESDIEEGRRIMAEQQIRRLPVIENGKLVGMVSLGDLAVKTDQGEEVSETLEEISEGAKATDQGAARGTGRKRPTARSARQMSKAHAQRDRSEEQERGVPSRPESEKVHRQNRVVPIRSQQKTNVRGDKSKTSSRHKTG